MFLSCSVSLVIPFEFDVQSVHFVRSVAILCAFFQRPLCSKLCCYPSSTEAVKLLCNVLGVANSQQRTNKAETFMHFDGDLKQHITPNKALAVPVRRCSRPVCLAEGLWQAGAHLTSGPYPWGSSALPQPARRSSSSLWERLHLSFQPMAHLCQRNK